MRRTILFLIFAQMELDMNRVIILENILALAAMAVLGPGTAVLVREAARQALALAKSRRRPTLH